MVKLWVLCTWVVSPLALQKMKVCSLLVFTYLFSSNSRVWPYAYRVLPIPTNLSEPHMVV
jgi:hypothetical protein